VKHVRFVEAYDFSHVPDGLWGGLETFGFGRPPADIDDDWLVAKAGDFYYGDLTGNVAHALYGAMPEDVRVVRSLRGLPAVRDLQVGSTKIKAGTVAALHMTHRGYLGDHHFFTNEECWYLKGENGFWGDNLPYGGFPSQGGHTFEITGATDTLRGQLTFDATEEMLREGSSSITQMSVNAMLSAIGPVCAAEPGIIIDDSRPHYQRAKIGAGA
jgi:hypothetical protein